MEYNVSEDQHGISSLQLRGFTFLHVTSMQVIVVKSKLLVLKIPSRSMNGAFTIIINLYGDDFGGKCWISYIWKSCIRIHVDTFWICTYVWISMYLDLPTHALHGASEHLGSFQYPTTSADSVAGLLPASPKMTHLTIPLSCSPMVNILYILFRE